MERMAKSIKEQKINDYLVARLKNNETLLYVAGEFFMGCKYVLLTLEEPLQEKYASAESIDELVETYNRAHEQDKSLLDPKTEFFAHCSNLCRSAVLISSPLNFEPT